MYIVWKLLRAFNIWMTRISFCIIKYKFVVRMREYSPRGTKAHFPCFTCTGSRFFKTVHKFKISEDRRVSVWKLKSLNLLCNDSNRHRFLVPENCRFYQINVIYPGRRRHCRCRPYAIFCVRRPALLKKMYRDSGKFIFHGALLFKDRAVCWNLYSFARNRFKCWFL